MRYTASEVFAMILKKKDWDKFTADPLQIHQVFYDLFDKNQELMDDFKFTKRINPFCLTLERVFTMLQLSGVLSRSNPYLIEYNINKSKLDQLIPDDKTAFEKIVGLDILDNLCSESSCSHRAA